MKESDIKVRKALNVVRPSYVFGTEGPTYSREELMCFMKVTEPENQIFVIYGVDFYEQYYILQAYIKIGYIVDTKEKRMKRFLGYKVLGLEELAALASEYGDRIKAVVFSDDYNKSVEELRKIGLNPFLQIFDGKFLFGKVRKALPVHYGGKRVIFTVAGRQNGGMFAYDTDRKSFAKLLDGDFRGLRKFEDGYLVLEEEKGIVTLDRDFRITKVISVEPELDLHGLDVETGSSTYIFAAEGEYDRIGVYDSGSGKKVEQIEIGMGGYKDRYHIKDLLVTPENIYMTMVSLSGVYGITSYKDDGAVVRFNRRNYCIDEIVADRLNAPHSIYSVGKDIMYCDSLRRRVCVNKEVVCEFNGFTRGLYLDGDNLYVGQSKLRFLVHTARMYPSISNDAGIHCFSLSQRESTFIPANFADDIYSVVVE